MTLDGYARGPWRSHAATLGPATRAKYRWAVEKHLTELVDEPLRALDVARLAPTSGYSWTAAPRRALSARF